LQSALVPVLRKLDLDGLSVDSHVPGDDGNDLVFERLQELRRDLCPVVNEDKLKPLLCDLAALGRLGPEVFG